MKRKMIGGVILFGSMLGLTGCGESAPEASDIFNRAKTTSDEISQLGSDGIFDKIKRIFERPGGGSGSSSGGGAQQGINESAVELANSDYESGSNPVVEINGNKSTLNPADWKESKVDYSDLDNLNRVGPATAYLNKDNLGKSEGREGQRWEPTGWNNQGRMIDGNKVHPYDRGHLIAYTVTFNLNEDGKFESGRDGSIDNPKNLFTQTSFSNRTLFQRYERMVRDSLADNKKVIYKVTPVFRDNELVARGANMEAISEDKSLDFNVYVNNVQPGFKINYSTGKTSVDPSMKVPR